MTDSEESTIVNALRTAAERYGELADAQTNDRLAAQFKLQQREALRLAERIDTQGFW